MSNIRVALIEDYDVMRVVYVLFYRVKMKLCAYDRTEVAVRALRSGIIS
jgi:hypothetical protein